MAILSHVRQSSRNLYAGHIAQNGTFVRKREQWRLTQTRSQRGGGRLIIVAGADFTLLSERFATLVRCETVVVIV
jgi:hypothetical protein